jgi:hypothetical protein
VTVRRHHAAGRTNFNLSVGCADTLPEENVMTALKVNRIVFGLCALALLALPAMAAAQSSTFVVALDRTGTPGTTQVAATDPMTGEPTTLTVDTGAFVNPCTLENVDVSGSTTISTVQSVDRWGTIKVSVSVVSKGTGLGWIPGAEGQTFTGSNYAFSESQSFKFQLPAVGDEFSSDFSDKLSLRGARSIDNWTIRANFRIAVGADGVIKILRINETGDVCKG